jgi:hypothetical protein
MARRALELSLVADRDDPGALTSQIAGQLRDALADGRLATGERLPATRMLAGLLGVSRTVVTGAYAQLFAEGWVEDAHARTYVADGAPGHPGASGSTEPARAGNPAALADRHSSRSRLRDRPAAGHRVDRGDRPRGVAPSLAHRRRERTGGLPDPRAAPACARPSPATCAPQRALFLQPARGDRGVAGPRPGSRRVAAAGDRSAWRTGIPGRPGGLRRPRAASRAVPGGLGGLRGGRAALAGCGWSTSPRHTGTRWARLVPQQRALTSWARATARSSWG